MTGHRDFRLDMRNRCKEAVPIDTAFITDEDGDYRTKDDEGYNPHWTNPDNHKQMFLGDIEDFIGINVRSSIQDAKYGAENVGLTGGTAFAIISAGYQGLAAGLAKLYRLKVDTTVPAIGEPAKEIKFFYIDGMKVNVQPIENTIILGVPFGYYVDPADPSKGTNFVMATKGNPFIITVSPQTADFRRGDSNADSTTDISDAIGILSFLFTGGKAPPCQKSADVTDDGTVDISDGVALLSHLFLGGRAPAEPFTACGVDPTADELTCEGFAGCP